MLVTVDVVRVVIAASELVEDVDDNVSKLVLLVDSTDVVEVVIVVVADVTELEESSDDVLEDMIPVDAEANTDVVLVAEDSLEVAVIDSENIVVVDPVVSVGGIDSVEDDVVGDNVRVELSIGRRVAAVVIVPLKTTPAATSRISITKCKRTFINAESSA